MTGPRWAPLPSPRPTGRSPERSAAASRRARPNSRTGFTMSLILNVTGGTGTYAGATGTINLNGFIGAGAATIVGAASGSIAYGTPVPTSPLDCLNGGWRNLAN